MAILWDLVEQWAVNNLDDDISVDRRGQFLTLKHCVTFSCPDAGVQTVVDAFLSLFPDEMLGMDAKQQRRINGGLFALFAFVCISFSSCRFACVHSLCFLCLTDTLDAGAVTTAVFCCLGRECDPDPLTARAGVPCSGLGSGDRRRTPRAAATSRRGACLRARDSRWPGPRRYVCPSVRLRLFLIVWALLIYAVSATNWLMIVLNDSIHSLCNCLSQLAFPLFALLHM